MTWDEWIGLNANSTVNYFARHVNGTPVEYKFNSLGFRGPEFYADPDITVFGSSFTFGVGLDWDKTWHQLLGDYRINCYAAAGWAVSNDQLVDLFNRFTPATGISIIQFREEKYTRHTYKIPKGPLCFKIEDAGKDPRMPTFSYTSICDQAADMCHPGPKTHKVWATLLKKMWNL